MEFVENLTISYFLQRLKVKGRRFVFKEDLGKTEGKLTETKLSGIEEFIEKVKKLEIILLSNN